MLGAAQGERFRIPAWQGRNLPMADKRRFLDVWIVESNTVYREVPFTVVADWVQQGRLLEDDMLKPSGTAEWSRVGASADFNVYLPKPQAYRSDDKAEALEPVQLDFTYKRRHDEEDDDVDMIPLIDVSLVLLIFFMLISAGAGMASSIQVPTASSPEVSHINPAELTVGIDLDADGAEFFSLSTGNKPPSGDEYRNIRTYEEMVEKLKEMLPGSGSTELTINAHRNVRSGLVRKLAAEVARPPFTGKVARVMIGVNEKSQ
jgi:biopolymer transport protein ExbD